MMKTAVTSSANRGRAVTAVSKGMMRMNTITIRKQDQAAAPAAMFKAPDNAHVAHELFLFFAENLKDGFIVTLDADGRSIAQPTGQGQR